MTQLELRISATPLRNKTLAAWLALVAGLFGLHRFYLHGRADLVGWLLPVFSAAGIYGIWRARHFGLDDRLSWLLVPIVGFVFAACALTAIVYGLTDIQDWNQRFNTSAAPEHPDGATNWLTVGALVVAMLLGSTVLVASIAFSLQHLFELQ